jgi:hypothetical protein
MRLRGVLLALVQQLRGHLRAFDQPPAVGQAHRFRRQFRGFAGLQVQCGQLTVLEAQQFEARVTITQSGFDRQHLVEQREPFAVRAPDVGSERFQLAVVVQQLALHRGPYQ